MVARFDGMEAYQNGLRPLAGRFGFAMAIAGNCRDVRPAG